MKMEIVRKEAEIKNWQFILDEEKKAMEKEKVEVRKMEDQFKQK